MCKSTTKIFNTSENITKIFNTSGNITNVSALNGEFRGQFKVSADIRHVMNDIMVTKKDLSLYTYGA